MDALTAFTFPSPPTPPSSSSSCATTTRKPSNRPSAANSHKHSRHSSTSSSTSSTTSSPGRGPTHHRTPSTLALSRNLASSLCLLDAPPVPQIPAAYRLTAQCVDVSASPPSSPSGAKGGIRRRGCARVGSVESIATVSSSGGGPGAGRAVSPSVGPCEVEARPEGDEGAEDEDEDEEEFWGCAGLVPWAEGEMDGFFAPVPTLKQRRRWGVCIGGGGVAVVV